MNNIFFTSDEHYQSPSIIKVCNRPFKDVEEMNETLIANHNAKVKAGDRVFHLGDIFLGRRSGVDNGFNKAKEILSRLNGQHFLILGNHDELSQRLDGFVWQRDMHKLKSTNDNYPNIFLCHYALRTWLDKEKGAWHLYGHSHGNLPENDTLSFDVGVDCWDFEPLSIEEVAQRMEIKRQVKEESDNPETYIGIGYPVDEGWNMKMPKYF